MFQLFYCFYIIHILSLILCILSDQNNGALCHPILQLQQYGRFKIIPSRASVWMSCLVASATLLTRDNMRLKKERGCIGAYKRAPFLSTN
jgi:hypothetical protein